MKSLLDDWPHLVYVCYVDLEEFVASSGEAFLNLRIKKPLQILIIISFKNRFSSDECRLIIRPDCSLQTTKNFISVKSFHLPNKAERLAHNYAV